MKIVQNFPPNIEAIKSKFNLHKGVIFTYGDTIYNPDNGDIDEPLLTHEQTHFVQQGTDPKFWWEMYLNDPEFRYRQELEAYRHQYRKFCQLRKDRNERNRFLTRIAQDLSSEIYGNLCTFNEAMREIKLIEC